MASELRNFSQPPASPIDDLAKKKFTFVVSSYYNEVTSVLLEGAMECLLSHGAMQSDLKVIWVPGAYELPLGAAKAVKEADAVICLGCVIKGETQHFDFICQTIALQISNISIQYLKPVSFGVLTPNTMQQALDRAGGKHGNKGIEAALAAAQMLTIQ